GAGGREGGQGGVQGDSFGSVLCDVEIDLVGTRGAVGLGDGPAQGAVVAVIGVDDREGAEQLAGFEEFHAGREARAGCGDRLAVFPAGPALKEHETSPHWANADDAELDWRWFSRGGRLRVGMQCAFFSEAAHEKKKKCRGPGSGAAPVRGIRVGLLLSTWPGLLVTFSPRPRFGGEGLGVRGWLACRGLRLSAACNPNPSPPTPLPLRTGG